MRRLIFILKKIPTRLLISFFSILFFCSVAPVFIRANSLTSAIPLIIYIIIVGIIVCFAKRIQFFIPLFFIAHLILCYIYFPLEQIFSFSWFFSFCAILFSPFTNSLDNYSMGSSLIALAIVAILIILAMILIINFKQWKTTFFLIFLYVFLLAAVWRMELLAHLFLITGLIFLIACLIKEPNLNANYLSLVLPASLLIFLLSIGLSFLIFYGGHQLPDILKKETTNIRENLSQKGFYEALYGGLNTNPDNGRATTGLRVNDENLGGPVYQNNSYAFSAISIEPHYWRVATRDMYTGTGWTSSTITYDHVGSSFSYSQYDKLVPNESGTSTIDYDFPKDSPIFTQGLPLATGNIFWNTPSAFDLGASLNYDVSSIHLYFSNRPDITTLSFSFSPVSITNEALTQSRYTNSDSEQSNQYTQLPESLPNRIKILTEELTKDKATQYEKVTAVESYLKQEGNFTYSLEDAPFTPDGRDYVDYFLFDSKIGYCEQFSSAMVVMLRTIGIQARWVKGFSAGSLTSTEDDGRNIYTVRNRDAHAWPEVYFEDVGWVDFEPTPSFSMNVADDDATVNSSNSSTSEQSSSSSDISSSSSSRSTASTSETVSSSNDANTSMKENLSQFIYSLRFLLVGLLVFCLVLIVIFRKDIFWLFFSAQAARSTSFKKTYSKLLKGLGFKTKRYPNETLQLYAERIVWNSATDKLIFIRLTEDYEEIVYGNEKDKVPTSKQKQNFKRIARNQGLKNKK